jgi:hypothetical protein
MPILYSHFLLCLFLFGFNFFMELIKKILLCPILFDNLDSYLQMNHVILNADGTD